MSSNPLPAGAHKDGSDTIDLVCFAGLSGLADYTVSLARYLAQHRPVRIVTSSPLDSRYAKLEIEILCLFRRVRHYPIDILKFFFFYIRSSRRLLFLQSWFVFPAVEGVLLRLLRLRGHRIYITVHDTLPHHPKPWSRWTLGFFYGAFDGLVAHSETSAKALRTMGITAPIKVIPHATYDLFATRRLGQQKARSELGLPPDKLIYLLFGHIDTRKGCLEFVECARKCADLDKVHFVIAGRNELSRQDRAKLDRYRGLNNLSIVDRYIPLEEVQLFFIASDAVVAPYREGTTSGVYRVAVGFDRPVVSTEVGDLLDAVSRGTAFSIGDGSDAAAHLEAFVRAHKDDLTTFTAGAVQRMAVERNSNTWESSARRYMEFLGEMESGFILSEYPKVDRNG